MFIFMDSEAIFVFFWPRSSLNINLHYEIILCVMAWNLNIFVDYHGKVGADFEMIFFVNIYTNFSREVYAHEMWRKMNVRKSSRLSWMKCWKNVTNFLVSFKNKEWVFFANKDLMMKNIKEFKDDDLFTTRIRHILLLYFLTLSWRNFSIIFKKTFLSISWFFWWDDSTCQRETSLNKTYFNF